MIKSPLRYPGEKSRAAELIASLIPPFDEFREPFVGGGSVFVHLKQKFPNRRYWINNLYFELFCFCSKLSFIKRIKSFLPYPSNLVENIVHHSFVI